MLQIMVASRMGMAGKEPSTDLAGRLKTEVGKQRTYSQTREVELEMVRHHQIQDTSRQLRT